VWHKPVDGVSAPTSTGALFYDPDGSGPAWAIKLAQMLPSLALTKADFFVI
jgi:hypothetical protein